jgi:monoamine oxidase
VFSVEPRDVSLLFVLFYIAAAGDEAHPGTLERLVTTSPGAQSDRIVGGTQLIPLRMAKALGKRVVLSSPVRKITQRKDRVIVESDGLTAVGQRVIVAIPPPLAGRLQYSPALPALRDQLTQRMPQGSVMKVIAIYDKPFWRDAGYSGQAVSEDGPANTTFDNTPPGGSPGILFGFVGGAQARAFAKLKRAARRQAVLDNFVTYYGDEARSLKSAFEMDWTQEAWTRGCPVGHTGRNVLHRYGHVLRKRSGHVHWAGTETADYWNGYMDGAVRSGERAAKEVLGALRR